LKITQINRVRKIFIKEITTGVISSLKLLNRTTGKPEHLILQVYLDLTAMYNL
jgi:hypothetical protein